MLKIRRFGWIRQHPDFNDKFFKFRRNTAVPVLSSTDLRSDPGTLPVRDQGDLGSCTGHGVGHVLEFGAVKSGGGRFSLSPLQIYAAGRTVEGTYSQDTGCQIRDVLKAVAQYGACLEEAWPYDVSKFADPLPDYVVFDAAHRKAISYHAVDQTENAIKGCLSEGFPVVYGFSVYESFESDAVAKSGVVPMPRRRENQVGGHCVAIDGYKTNGAGYIVRNSWGETWGQGGYCIMPEQYVHDPDLSSDFWTVRVVALP